MGIFKRWLIRGFLIDMCIRLFENFRIPLPFGLVVAFFVLHHFNWIKTVRTEIL